MSLHIVTLFGYTPVNSKTVYDRTLHNIYELLERIYLKENDPIKNVKNEEGVIKFYKILMILGKKTKNKKQIPFICRKMGNA